MKIDNYKELVEATDAIESGLKKVIQNLNSLLADRRYITEIKYNKKDYNFIPPTTEEEQTEMNALRNEFIDKLLKNTINRNIKSISAREKTIANWKKVHATSKDEDEDCILPELYGWDDILSFSKGPDVEDYEITKAEKVSYMPEVDADGKRITAKPLDMNTIDYINQIRDLPEEERLRRVKEILDKDTAEMPLAKDYFSGGPLTDDPSWWDLQKINNKWLPIDYDK